MKKRVLSTLLALNMVLSLLSGTALAVDADVEGETPALLVEGTDEAGMAEKAQPDKPYEVSEAEIGAELYANSDWVSCRVNGGNLYFDPTTGAVADCDENVTGANIPGSINGVPVTSIGNNAFRDCSNLTSITIPASITSIGSYAFSHCSSLTSITIPANVTSIGNNAFFYCSALTSITIPGSVTSIGQDAFYYCSGLTSAGPIGGGYGYEFGWTKKIPSHAFAYCSGLTNITLPDSITSIGDYAFFHCSGLISVTIPDGVTNIDDYTFSSCNALTSITLPDSVTSIGETAFYGCSKLTSITIPDSVTSIGHYAFEDCSRLTSVTLPESVTSIGLNAFVWCNNLTDIYYGGSKTQWQNITIYGGNDPLSQATIHYYYTSPDDANTFTEVHQLKSWDVFTNTVYFHDGTSYLRVSEDAVDLDSLLNCWVTCTLRNSDIGVLLVSMEKLEAKTETVIKTLKAYDVFTNTVYFTDDTSYPLGENVSIDLNSLLNAQVTCTIESDPVKGIYLTSIAKYSDEFQNHIVDIDFSELKQPFIQKSLSIRIHFDQELDCNAIEKSTGYIQFWGLRNGSKEVYRTVTNGKSTDGFLVDESDPKYLIVVVQNSIMSTWNENNRAIPYDTRIYITISPDAIAFTTPGINFVGISDKDAIMDNRFSTVTNWGLTADIDFFSFANADCNDIPYGGFDKRRNYVISDELYNLIRNDISNPSLGMNFIMDFDRYFRNWNGSCMGMCSVMAVDAINAIDLEAWEPGARHCADLDYPVDSRTPYGTQDLINYYHLLQARADFPKQEATKNSILQGAGSILFNDWEQTVRELINVGKKINNEKTPIILHLEFKDNTGKRHVHACLAYGFQENADSYVLTLYDPSYPSQDKKIDSPGTTLVIQKNNYNVTFDGGWGTDCEVITLGYINPHDLDKYNIDSRIGTAGKNLVSLSTDKNYDLSLIYCAAVSDFLVTNSSGKYIRFLDGVFSGDMLIYSAQMVGEGQSASYCFEVDNDTEFTYSTDGDYGDFTVAQMDGTFRAILPNGNTNIVVKPGTSIAFFSENNAPYQIIATTESNEARLLSIEGECSNAVTAQYVNNRQQIQLNTEDLDKVKIFAVKGDNVTEYQIDFTQQGPVVATPIFVTGIGVKPQSVTLEVGDVAPIAVQIYPANASNKDLNWSSDNDAIATVDDGIVTAVGVGSATITVSTLDGGYTAHCMVTVNAASQLPMGQHIISFNPNGGTTSSIAEVTDSNGKLSSLPAATRSDHTFTGWYTSPTGGEQITTETIFSGDTTVYAHWIYSGSNDDRSTGSDWVPSGNNSSQSAFSITVPYTSHGTVTVSPKSAAKGNTVTISAIPDPGHELASLTVTDSKGNALGLTDKGNGKYTFTMPGSAVTVAARFEPAEQMPEFAPESNPNWVIPYTDVSANAWYYNPVRFVSESSLMNGVTATQFAPDANLSRAQLTQILYNKEGTPAVSGGSPFTDVAAGTWYTNAVVWASADGIVGGYGDGQFGPNDNITREQLAVMLWRYAEEPAASVRLTFSDASQISSFARPAICWAVENGILNGKGGNILDPKGFATRAEVAQMLKNYLDK